MTPETLLLLVSLGTPSALALLKWLLPKTPKVVIPLLAPGVGVVIELCAQWAGAPDNTPMRAAIAGALGVFFREVADQVGKFLRDGPLPAGKVLLLLGVPALLVSGCATKLAPGGAYTDPVLYRADQTISTTYEALHSFVRWEHQNRPALEKYPEITRAADGVRRNAQAWITSAIALRDAYEAAPNATNLAALDQALAVLNAAVTEAAKYATTPIQ